MTAFFYEFIYFNNKKSREIIFSRLFYFIIKIEIYLLYTFNASFNICTERIKSSFFNT